jgi:hypothetical protein
MGPQDDVGPLQRQPAPGLEKVAGAPERAEVVVRDVGRLEEAATPDAPEDAVTLRRAARLPIAGGEALTRRQAFLPSPAPHPDPGTMPASPRRCALRPERSTTTGDGADGTPAETCATPVAVADREGSGVRACPRSTCPVGRPGDRGRGLGTG